MQKQLTQLLKLIDRKKDYLQRCENPKTKDIIKAEINIIENFIDSSVITSEDLQEQFGEAIKLNKALTGTIERMEAIFLIHGINDFPAWLNKDKKILIGQLLEMKAQSQIQIPEQLQTSIKY